MKLQEYEFDFMDWVKAISGIFLIVILPFIEVYLGLK